MRYKIALVIAGLALAGCSGGPSTQPEALGSLAPQSPALTASSATSSAQGQTTSQAAATPSLPPSAPATAGPPSYEPAYYDGMTVTINAIEFQQLRAPAQAQADFYEVVYPNGWQSLGIGTPQCDPCDHDHNGIDAMDYHDHVLDSMPSSPGHGEYRALWHVYVVTPNYTGNAAHDAAVTTAYASHIPAKSEAAVLALANATLPDGSPVALDIDTHFYFLCAVVSQNASNH